MIKDEKSGFYAKVVLDSISPANKRLISVEAKYWRAIHSEILTHRDRARNAASSRAIPFWRIKDGQPVDNCTFSRIKDHPFMPVFIGAEQKGMQSGDELSEPNRSMALEIIDRMRNDCLDGCKRLYGLGVHKSIINRYLEPWSFITVIMTATEWKNFFRLRVHPKAEKHFNLIAGMIKQAISESAPQQLEVEEWHLPYIGIEDYPREEMLEYRHIKRDLNRIEELKQVSAARCARLSYLTQDGKRDLVEDMKLFNTLIHPKIEQDRDDDVIHRSPLEHVGQSMEDGKHRSGPFIGWKQFRKEFPNENVEG